MYVNIYICMYVHTYIRMYVCMNALAQQFFVLFLNIIFLFCPMDSKYIFISTVVIFNVLSPMF